MPPPPSPSVAGSEVPTAVRNPFPFVHKPNTLDRDRIVVPAGWDSWGKIAVLREGFDARMWGESWEHDLEEAEGHGSGEAGAKKLFASLVPDQGEKVSTAVRHSQYFSLMLGYSHMFYLQSITQYPNKRSSLGITTKTQRKATEILEHRSEIQQTSLRVLRQVSLDPSAVVLCLMWNVFSVLSWKIPQTLWFRLPILVNTQIVLREDQLDLLD